VESIYGYPINNEERKILDQIAKETSREYYEVCKAYVVCGCLACIKNIFEVQDKHNLSRNKYESELPLDLVFKWYLNSVMEGNTRYIGNGLLMKRANFTKTG
jgi:hypothetical protein